MKKALILILICLAVLSVILTGCNTVNQNKPLKPQSVSPSPSSSPAASPSPDMASPSPTASPTTSPAKS